MTTLYLNVVHDLISASSATSLTGTTYATPNLMTTLTWQTIFGAAPGAISISLQGSLDATNFFLLDNTTVVGGEVATIDTNVPYVRALIVTNADPVSVTVKIICKNK